MSIPLRNVDSALIGQKLAEGAYRNVTAGPELRRFAQSEPLEGHMWQIVAPDRNIIKMMSVGGGGASVTKPTDHCLWCRRFVPANTSIGIPISLERKPDGLFVTTRGTTCSCECSSALLERERLWPISRRNTLHRDSVYILSLIHQMIHPGKRLVEAPDYVVATTSTPEAIEASRQVFIPTGITFCQVPHTYQLLTR